MENKLINEILRKFSVDYEEDLRLRFDSIRMVSLIMEIEEVFNIEIREIDFNKLNSVKKIIDEYINNKK